MGGREGTGGWGRDDRTNIQRQVGGARPCGGEPKNSRELGGGEVTGVYRPSRRSWRASLRTSNIQHPTSNIQVKNVSATPVGGPSMPRRPRNSNGQEGVVCLIGSGIPPNGNRSSQPTGKRLKGMRFSDRHWAFLLPWGSSRAANQINSRRGSDLDLGVGAKRSFAYAELRSADVWMLDVGCSKRSSHQSQRTRARVRGPDSRITSLASSIQHLESRLTHHVSSI